MTEGRRRRWLRAAGALAAVVGLAGCSADDDQVGSTEAVRTTTTGPSERTDRPTTRPPTPTASPTPVTPSCDDRTAAITAQLREVEAQIDQLEAELESTQRTLSELRAERDYYPGGWPTETVEAARSVGEMIRPGVVVLEFAGGGGTGWFIDDHHVITNSHVAQNEGEPTGWTVEGESFSLTRVAADDDLSPDLAVLRTDFSGTPLPTAPNSDLPPREPVLHVGHPFGAGNWVTALGHFLWKRELDFIGIDPTTVMYTSTPGRQGVSGAPLVTLEGEVVACTYGAIAREHGVVGEAPEPADDRVVDYEISPKVWGNHVPIEIVREHYERWTT